MDDLQEGTIVRAGDEEDIPSDPRGKINQSFTVVCNCGVNSSAVAKGKSEKVKRENVAKVFLLMGWKLIDNQWTCPKCEQGLKSLLQARPKIILPPGYQNK